MSRRAQLALFIARRLLWVFPVLLAAVVITFVLMHLAPGSPWNADDPQGRSSVQLSEAQVRQLDAKYGLDQPWWKQLAIYVGNIVQLDLGDSYRYQGQQVSDLILRSVPHTLTIGIIALAFILPVGVVLGMLAALRQNSRIDYAVTGLATFGASVPNFVVGIVLILVFSVNMNRMTGGTFFLPSGGFGLDEHLILPVITLSLLPVAFIARLARSSTLEVLRQDHMRTALAKGLRPRVIMIRHVLKNALVPVLTTLGPLFTFLITGTVIVESLFQIPGLGGTFVQSIGHRDYPVILGATIVYALVVAVANLVVDLLYVAIDPRVRPS